MTLTEIVCVLVIVGTVLVLTSVLVADRSALEEMDHIASLERRVKALANTSDGLYEVIALLEARLECVELLHEEDTVYQQIASNVAKTAPQEETKNG